MHLRTHSKPEEKRSCVNVVYITSLHIGPLEVMRHVKIPPPSMAEPREELLGPNSMLADGHVEALVKLFALTDDDYSFMTNVSGIGL